MNKNIVIGIVVVIVITGGIYWFVQSQNGPNGALPFTTNPTPPASTLTPGVSPIPTSTVFPTPAPRPVTHNITIQNFAFNPASISIKKGDTIVWTNKDQAGHTVTGDNGGPSSTTIGANETYDYTFNSAGTFTYHCAIHPSMTGTVSVAQ